MIVDDDQINILVPSDNVMESALSQAITSGEIYDDAEKVKIAEDATRSIVFTVSTSGNTITFENRMIPELENLSKEGVS